jgi:hypothetical protein
MGDSGDCIYLTAEALRTQSIAGFLSVLCASAVKK